MTTIHASIFPDEPPTIAVDPSSPYPVRLRIDTVTIHYSSDPRTVLRALETEIRAAHDALDQQEATK